MVKPIPGTSLYISDTGDIFYYDGQVCRLPVKDGLLEIEICGQVRYATREFLTLYALFEIPTFVRFEDVYFIPMNVSRKHVPWKAMFKRPYYFDKDKKYRISPSFPTIAVSRTGEAICITSKKKLNPCPSKIGYVYVDVYNPTINDWRHISLHQLVAHTWVMKNQDEHHYTVNHINGIRDDNRVENLEWVTPSYNSRDAKLRKYSNAEVIGKVRDITTGEVTEFTKLKDLYNFIGIAHRPSGHFKGLKRKDLINGKYEVRIEGDKRPWYYTANNTFGNKSSKYIITVTEPNGAVFVFNGVPQLRDHYQLYGGKKSAKEMCEILKEKFPGFTIDCIDKSLATLEVEVMNTKTNEITKFKNTFEVAKELHIEFKRVRALVASNGRLVYHGYRMRIISEDPWTDKIKEVSPRTYKVKVTNKATKEITIHPSMTSAATEMCVERSTVRRMIASPNMYDKYTVEIFDEEF